MTIKGQDHEELKKMLVDGKADISAPRNCMKYRDDIGSSINLLRYENHSVIIGDVRAEKHILTSWLMAASLGGTVKGKLIGTGDPKYDTLHFETYRSTYDAVKIRDRVIELAEYKAPNFKTYCMREYTPQERIRMIDFAIKENPAPVGLVVIDEFCDLVSNVNNEKEVFNLIQKLKSWTGTHRCHVVAVIDQINKKQGVTGKLATTLVQKAECVFEVVKGKNSKVSTVICGYNKNGDEFSIFGLDE
jgi:hypothetical protein